MTILTTVSVRERSSSSMHEDYHRFFAVYGVLGLFRFRRSCGLAYASMEDCDYLSVVALNFSLELNWVFLPSLCHSKLSR